MIFLHVFVQKENEILIEEMIISPVKFSTIWRTILREINLLESSRLNAQYVCYFALGFLLVFGEEATSLST